MRNYETVLFAAFGAASSVFLYTALTPKYVNLYDNYFSVNLHSPFCKALVTAIGVYLASD